MHPIGRVLALLRTFWQLLVYIEKICDPLLKMRRKSFLGEFEVWLKSHSAQYSDEIGAKIIALLPKVTEICLPKGLDPRKCISEKLAIKR